MPEDQRIQAVPVDISLDIRTTDGDSFDLQANMARTRLGGWNVFVSKNPFVFKHSGFHYQFSSYMI